MRKDYDAALVKLYRIQKTVADERQQIWRTIKTEAPEIAAFLSDVNAAFGKPEAVWVRIGERIIIEKGVLLPFKHDKYFKG